MGLIGGLLGQGLGALGGGFLGGQKGQQAGQQIGGVLGNLLPFKKGGKVPGPKGKPRVVLAHGGETILPADVKPTKAQVKAIKKRGGKM